MLVNVGKRVVITGECRTIPSFYTDEKIIKSRGRLHEFEQKQSFEIIAQHLEKSLDNELQKTNNPENASKASTKVFATDL